MKAGNASGSIKSNRIGVIGIGNALMGDDGVGIAMVERLKNESLPKNVSIIDIGTAVPDLLHVLSNLDAAIIIDAVDFGGSPGETHRFDIEDIKSVKECPMLSTHGCDLLNMVKLSKKLDGHPKTVTIFAVQPGAIAPSMKLSLSLEKKLPGLLKDILGLIGQING